MQCDRFGNARRLGEIVRRARGNDAQCSFRLRTYYRVDGLVDATVAARDESNALCGGARATVNMGLVEVRGLWLDERVRGTGLGRKIMAALEDEARRRGATRAALDTYDFQARAFYEHIGYRLFGGARNDAAAPSTSDAAVSRADALDAKKQPASSV